MDNGQHKEAHAKDQPSMGRRTNPRKRQAWSWGTAQHSTARQSTAQYGTAQRAPGTPAERFQTRSGNSPQRCCRSAAPEHPQAQRTHCANVSSARSLPERNQAQNIPE